MASDKIKAALEALAEERYRVKDDDSFQCLGCLASASQIIDIEHNDGCVSAIARAALRELEPTCPMRILQLISGSIGLMNHSDAQQAIGVWWNAVRPELEKETCSCPLQSEVERLRAELEQAMGHFDCISSIGGNLPDERLMDRTGPNDASARGIMYVSARQLAIACAAKIREALK